MSKEKSAAELFEEFNKNYDSKETKKFVAQVKADSQKLDKVFVTTPSDQTSNYHHQDDHKVEKIGHTKGSCEIM